MKAGKLRHRLTLQNKTKTRDEYGAETEGWVDVATVWAAIEPLQGREYLAAQQIQADVTHRITIRYRADIRPAMRGVLGARAFDITSVIDPEERHQELQLMAVEVISA
jgi:SPP1 family predicted phage head-tail adaptor